MDEMRTRKGWTDKSNIKLEQHNISYIKSAVWLEQQIFQHEKEL